jgi:amino acid transporter
VTVGEAQNPRKAVPRAVKLTFFRIVFFYLMLVFLLGLVVPYNNPRLQSTIEAQKSKISAEVSPFVIAAQLAGMNDAVANIINACLLVFTVSAANSDLYIATRTLYSLSVEGSAPKIFSRTTDRGVPIYALGLSSACCLVAFVSAAVAAFKVFQNFISLVTIFGLLLWIAILISHIHFVRARKAQNIPDSALAYVSLFGARGSMVALVFALLILLFNGFPDFIHSTTTGNFDWKNFIVDYIGVGIFAALFFGYKLVMKTKFVTPMECDLYGGKAKIDEDEAEFLAEEMRLKGGVLETKFERAYRYTLGNFF